MFTKKTRVLSAVLTVCMLISMLACFVVPAVAAGSEAGKYYDEVVNAAGLVDTSAMPDIKHGLVTGVKAYKISDRAGFDKLDEILVAGDTLAGVTLYQSADVDFGWKNFHGVGGTFTGTFDGNGFVIENLVVVQPTLAAVGLFLNTSGATFKNLGIASGFILGQNATGSLAGGNNDNVKAYNCWSAATVFAAGGSGSGGLFSKTNTAAVLENCYFLGMVYDGSYSAGGLSGNVNNSKASIKNSYVYGEVLSGKTGYAYGGGVCAQGLNNVFVRAQSCATSGFTAANNYYRAQRNAKSTYEVYDAAHQADSSFVLNDQAVEKTKDDFKTLAASLNGTAANLGTAGSYTVKYSDSTAGYPVITYYDANGDVYIKRTAHTEDNVGGVDVFKANSPLFSKLYADLDKYNLKEATLGDIELATPADVFALIMIGANPAGGGNLQTLYGVTSITFTADIDMNKLPFFQVDGKCALDTFAPIAATWTLAGTTEAPFVVDGGNHVVKNLRNKLYTTGTTATDFTTGFFGNVEYGQFKNLGLVNFNAKAEKYQDLGSGRYSRFGMLVGCNKNGRSSSFENCFVTGTLTCDYGASNGNDVGAMLNRDWGAIASVKNCWSDLTVINPGGGNPTVVGKGLTFGSWDGKISGAAASAYPAEKLNEVYYFCDEGNLNKEHGNPPAANHVAYLQTALPEVDSMGARAYAMNQTTIGKKWKLDAEGDITWATGAADATYRFTVKKKDVKGNETVEYGYANAGSKVTLDLGVYTVDAASVLPAGYENGSFTMPANNDAVFVLTTTGFDFEQVKAYYAAHEALNKDYFNADFGAGMDALVAIIAQEANPTDTAEALVDKFAAAKARVDGRELLVNTVAVNNDNLKIVPNFTEYELYKDANTAKAWGVATKEDWIALVDAVHAPASFNIYFKANIDLENEVILPLCYGTAFKGHVYGMGHYIEGLDVVATTTSTNTAAGLISAATGGATINDLGIKSGTVGQKWVSTDDGGLGLFVGYCGNGGVTFNRCWAGPEATVKLLSTAGTSTGVFAGRNGAILKNCYSYAKFDNTPMDTLAGGWTSSNTAITNSFGVFDPNRTVAHGQAAARPSGTSPAAGKGFAKNSYAVGADFFIGKPGDNRDASYTEGEHLGKVLDGDTALGEVAWLMNKGRTAFSADASDAKYQADTSDWVYWTLDADGYAVFGTEANQTRKLSIVATAANDKEFAVYGKEGDTVDLLKLLNVAELPANALVAAAGNVGAVTGTTFTFGKGDAFFTTDIKLLNTADYNTLSELYAKHPEFYGATVKAKLDAIKVKIDGEGYEQSALDADIKEIVPLFEVTPASVVPVTMNRAAVTLICGEEIAAVATPVGNETYLQVGIYNVDDLIYASQGDAEEWTTAVEGVYNFPAKFSGKQTLNLMADLDLAGVTKFVRIHDLAAAFDGRNHTIKNWSGTNVAGFFQFPKKSIKNLRFYNCTPTVASSGAMVVGQYWGSTLADALVENVTIENCTVSGTNTYVGGVVLGEARATITQTLRNITLINTKFTHVSGINYTESSGLLVGRVREGGNMVFENILIDNCENDNGNHDGVGLVFGVINHKGLGSEASNKVTIDGLIVRNSKGANIEAVLGGAWQRVGTTKPNSITLKNALIYGNDTGSAPLIKNHHTSTAAISATATNVYTDVADTVYGGVELAAGKLATADFANGKAAYLANKAAGETLYKVDAAGKIYFADAAPADAKAPVKVAFVDAEGAEKLAYYTNGAAMLVGADAAAVKALADCKILNGEGVDVLDTLDAELAKEFAADATYTLSSHKLKATHVEDTHTHDIVCENGCGYSSLGNACADGEGYPKVVDPTEQAGGYTAHKCSECGHEWNTDVTNKLVVLRPGKTSVAMKGEEAYVDIEIANSDLLTEATFELTFDVNTFEYVGVNRDDVTVDVSKLGEGILTITVQSEDGFTNWDGELWATVEFKVKETAEAGESEIEVVVANANTATTGSPATSTVTVTRYMRGDVDQNGSVNIADVTYMLRHFSGEDLLNETEKGLGDMDRNGTFSIVDALYLLRAQATNP